MSDIKSTQPGSRIQTMVTKPVERIASRKEYDQTDESQKTPKGRPPETATADDIDRREGLPTHDECEKQR